MSKLHQIKSYFNHWLNVVDEHSIHSPFLYDFYNSVIKKDNTHEAAFKPIEGLRSKLLQNPTEIKITDLGAKSPHFTNDSRTIAGVAATSLCPPDLCRLLYRIVNYFDSGRIIELGTSMGLTSLYLGLTPKSQVFTFEGNPSMINIALTHFEYFETRNIKLVEGNLDTTLPEFLQATTKIDFVLMDANHRYEPTMRYFKMLMKRISEKGVIVIDDIYYSKEMTRAWDELRHHDLVYASADLFRCGILFFDTTLNKQHFVWSL